MSDARRPHILVLMSDQHRPDMMGCAGDSELGTPALDSIAAAGVRLAACYANHPVCVPSRACFMAGRLSHDIGVWDNLDSLGSNIPTIAHGMGLAGYRTVLCGRMHFVGGDQKHGFAERVTGDLSSAYLGTNRSEYRHRGFYGNLTPEEATSGPAHDLAFDQAVTADACRIIRDHEETGDPRPLFLVVSYYAPHDPYRVYARYQRPWDLPPSDPDGGSLHPLQQANRRQHGLQEMSASHVRACRAAYRGKIRFLDDLISNVLDHWRFAPWAGDSVIAYTSDHGEMLGDHGLWAKNVFFEASAGIPCLLAAPGRIPAGQVDARPMGLTDLTATLLDAAGAEPLPNGTGVSLWPALTGQGDAWPEQVLAEATFCDGGPSRLVRRGPWKLSWFPGREVEFQLFNLADDPRELRDRAADPACADLLAELRAACQADGWSAARVIAARAARRPDKDYINRWGIATRPVDPVQWGIAAPF